MWNAEVANDADAKRGLAPVHRPIDRNPPLGHNAMLQQADPTGLEHLILAGGRVGTSPSRPSPLSMPSFAWKLTDQEIADVATYLRNSWGNQAAPVSLSDVRAARKRLNLDTVHLTVNSGDAN
jgi:hypothetical protein